MNSWPFCLLNNIPDGAPSCAKQRLAVASEMLGHAVCVCERALGTAGAQRLVLCCWPGRPSETRLQVEPRPSIRTQHKSRTNAQTETRTHAHTHKCLTVLLKCVQRRRRAQKRCTPAQANAWGRNEAHILKRKCTLNSLVTSYYERTRALTFENVCQEQQHQQSPLEEDAGRRQHQHGHVSAACEAAHCVPRRRHFPLVAGALVCNLVPVYV